MRAMEDIDEIRQKKLAELQKKMQDEETQEEAQKQAELRKQLVLKSILTPEARSRLTNLRLSRPEYVKAIEQRLIGLAQSGNLREKVTDSQLKGILRKIARSKSRETKIKRV